MNFGDNKVKFICPFCTPETKAKLAQLEERGLLSKIKSNKIRDGYFAYMPVAATSRRTEPSRSGKKARREESH